MKNKEFDREKTGERKIQIDSDEITKSEDISVEEMNKFLHDSELETGRLLMDKKVKEAMHEEIDSMEDLRFSNPLVWLKYLKGIKDGTNSELMTLGDFVKYIQEADNSNKRRFDFLNRVWTESLGVDLDGGDEDFLNDSFQEFMDSRIQIGVIMKDDILNKWQQNESRHNSGYPESGQVDSKVA